MYLFRKAVSNKALSRPNWILAVTVLLMAGVVYRVAASRLRAIVDSPIALPVPLKAFPFTVNNWTGRDVPLTETLERVAGTDDSLSRLYRNKATGQWANVYVAYSARPRTMIGHRPEICYVAGGWVHDSTKKSQFVSSAGRTIPCLVHRFHKAAPRNDEIAVLNFYIVNGRFTNDERVFSGVRWRSPNIAGDRARYVAQVQVSSVSENSVRTASKHMADLVLGFFPDENGRVGATEYGSITGVVVE